MLQLPGQKKFFTFFQLNSRQKTRTGEFFPIKLSSVEDNQGGSDFLREVVSLNILKFVLP